MTIRANDCQIFQPGFDFRDYVAQRREMMHFTKVFSNRAVEFQEIKLTHTTNQQSTLRQDLPPFPVNNPPVTLPLKVHA